MQCLLLKHSKLQDQEDTIQRKQHHNKQRRRSSPHNAHLRSARRPLAAPRLRNQRVVSRAQQHARAQRKQKDIGAGGGCDNDDGLAARARRGGHGLLRQHRRRAEQHGARGPAREAQCRACAADAVRQGVARCAQPEDAQR